MEGCRRLDDGRRGADVPLGPAVEEAVVALDAVPAKVPIDASLPRVVDDCAIIQKEGRASA